MAGERWATIGALARARRITAGEIEAAVSAYLADPAPGVRPVGRYRVDVAAAVAANDFTRDVLEDPDAPEPRRRNAVRTAIRLARPEGA